MSNRPGCLGRLLPARLLNLVQGRAALTASVGAADRPPQADPQEAEAVDRARRAAQRCMHALHSEDGFSVQVLDEVGGAVQALADAAVALADRMTQARRWVHQRDAEQLRTELVELELGGGGSLAKEQADRQRAASIKRQLQQLDEVSRGLAELRAQLLATVRELERLEASVTRVRLDGGASGLLQQVRRQEAETRRALEAWQETASELS